MICDNCSWNYVEETYPFCIGWRRQLLPFCPRFHQADNELLAKVKNTKTDDSICPVCKRDKDPGKCWWCGN